MITEGKTKAARIKRQNEFETKLIDVYVEASNTLTEDELISVVNRFAAKILPSGRG
jgi:hypothetical protein